jgi:hypothetical protein
MQRRVRLVAPPPETWIGANEARFRKIRVNKARRLAKSQGLSLRESDRGFSLVDSTRGHIVIDGRTHLTLNELEDHLDRGR